MLRTLRNPRRAWSQWRTLSGFEQLVFLRALLILPLTRLALRFMSVPRLQQIFGPRRNTGAASADASATARRVVKMVRIAANHGPVACNCLPRALAAQWLLRSLGVTSEVRFGAATRERQFEAHAWIECAGQVFDVTGEDVDKFVPFDRPLVGGPK